jgi:putative Holliday junction resolvase
MGRMVGLDYGEKRVGVAISDSMGIVATPRETLLVGKRKDLFAAILAICAELDADKIVVGLPLHLDGRMSELAHQVERFVEQLSKETSIEIVTWDERLTSKSAEAVLIQAGTRRDKRKTVIDKLAAQIMLQHYLDAQAYGAEG